jgi:hypothetical protein
VISSGWDFWDPFMQQPPPPPSSRSATEEEWEATTTTGSEVVVMAGGAAASMATPASGVVGFSKETSSELAMVVSRNSKDLVEVIKELDDYFLKAADAGSHVSFLLQVPTSGFSDHSKASKFTCMSQILGCFCLVGVLIYGRYARITVIPNIGLIYLKFWVVFNEVVKFPFLFMVNCFVLLNIQVGVFCF